MRWPGARAAWRSALHIVLLVGMPAVASAQDSLSVTPKDTVAVMPTAPPSSRPADGRPTSPTGAMLRSFAIPGWGQAVYGRKVTAGVMLGVEGLAFGMLLKISSERAQVVPTDTIRLHSKAQQKQDWITIVVFNHLMSGLEAYVSSHLYDFPGDLNMRALPAGGDRKSVV